MLRFPTEHNEIAPRASAELPVTIQWDTSAGTLSLPLQRQVSTQTTLRSFLGRPTVSRRDLEKVVGLLQFCSILDPLLKVALKDAGMFWKTAATKTKRDAKWPMLRPLSSLLSPWLKENTFDKPIPLRPLLMSLTIHSDGSRWGWGETHRQPKGMQMMVVPN